jgi:hypothetical protein
MPAQASPGQGISPWPVKPLHEHQALAHYFPEKTHLPSLDKITFCNKTGDFILLIFLEIPLHGRMMYLTVIFRPVTGS